MNLSGNTIRVSLMAATIFLFTGCNKLYDYIKHHPGGIEDDCRIKFISNQYYGTVYTMSFEYNSLGNPVHITSVPVSTGYPNRKFVYDQKNRLIQYHGYYDDSTNFEYRISFYYNKQNRVSHDTGYFLGGIKPDGTIYGASKRATQYEYDQYGRISRTIAKELLYEDDIPSIRNYEYDTKGNLRMNGIVYDNKTSIQRTHPIWMFLDRNYSVNNGFTATVYNNKGLPLKTRIGKVGYNSFLWWPVQDADFTWECK